jgi:hypothetical protein
MLSESIAKLVQYGITTGLTPECEETTQQIFCWTFFMRMTMRNRTTLRNLLILKQHWVNCWMKP